MLSFLLSDVSISQLLARMAATACVVIGVALAVGRLGPAIGGALAGLPIVLGPGFFFITMQAPAGFVSAAAVYSLMSLCATQLFLLAYIATAGRTGPWISLLAALAAWTTAVVLFRLFPTQPLSGIALFAIVTFAARALGAAFVRTTSKPIRVENLGLLFLRGILAGLLVAVVTTAASQLGATSSGLLLAFPIGYTVLAITIHEQFGAGTVIATLYSAIRGTISLAGFCTMLALAMPSVSPAWAFLLALAISLAITVGLILRMRPARP